MERYVNILAEIEISTTELKIKSIQDVLKLSKENSNTSKEFWNQVSESLWGHLKTGFRIFDDQLLCATCFYTVIPLTDKQDVYLTELLQMIDKELFIKKNPERKSAETSNVVSMMYGMFQSTFLTQKIHNDVSKTAPVLKSMFDLLLLMGYEYSQFTFISFKTIKLFKKVEGTVFEDCIFSKENEIKLLNFVNHNWENPVTGIRDLNRCIFQTLISMIDDEMYETVIKEINGFYWNKAKYLMLSEVIENKEGNLLSLVHGNKWVDGLIYSLHKPGLVSAGADMYYALLKQINFESDWCTLFQRQVINILTGTSSKAIENFKNFWCLTTLKKFPTLSYVLFSELNELDKSEQYLCSQLCVIKQANKLGIIKKNWSSTEDFVHIENTVFIEKNWGSTEDFGHVENTVFKGIQHCNYNNRMLAFDIVCVSHRKLVPSQLEYLLIVDFVKNNVNSDCTVLRLSMLNSLNYFLTQLHSIFLIVLVKDENSNDLQNLLEFCKRLQNLVINAINLNGNYQRKITSVKLCNTILSCFSKIPCKKRGQTRHANITLIEYLKENGCWLLSTEEFVLKLVSLLRDPTDDVRENVIKLLLNHYLDELKIQSIMQFLVNSGLKSMKSKFFYEIRCGQTMFRFLTNLVIKDKHSIPEYKSVEDIFYFAFNELITEHKAKTNIVESIETGKQLHSLMNILLVVLETSVSNSYSIDIHRIMQELIEVVEIISNQFAWEESSTSSDFSKISDMVESVIDNSGLSIGDKADHDHTKISGLHQIVLNSLWLNVKASCDLASILVQLNVNDASMCEKCLNIITHVLETSRHKGVIEAAGASLGKGIQFLSSLPDENKASEVPNTFLRCKLNDLISETNKMASITRRGAGLSIMVHKIVSNDMKKGKPLFHYFINTLLQICDTTKDTPKKDDENQIDLPKAIYIHFMTRIVTDSSLASDMMFYFARLAELAFSNLTSHHWQIRNAALQLYGALIPKQIGEKKASGSDEQTTATVACDELRTHSPKLWNYIMERLQDSFEPDIVQSHSNLVPILNVLANSAKRYSFSYDMAEQETADEELFDCLILLLDSPLYTVRRLTAKCLFNIHDFVSISNNLWYLLIHGKVSENFLHGSLILLNLCHKYYYSHQAYKQHFDKFKSRLQSLFRGQIHSYLCRKLFEDTFLNSYTLEDIEKTILEMNENMHFPGVSLWAEAKLKKYIINTSPWDEIPALLNKMLKLSNFEKYCEFILLKVINNKVSTQECKAEVLLNVVEVLLAFEKKYESSVIWEIIFEISLSINLSGELDTSELLKMLLERETVYKIRFIIPLLARNIANVQDDDKLNLMKIIETFCNFENSDVVLRCIAAIANNELASEFDNITNSMKVTSIKCAIMLLQDEDEDVRHTSVNFYHRISKHEGVLQPYVCLNIILSKKFLNTTFNGSQYLINELVKQISEILESNHSTDKYNPFANDSKNIYFEPNLMKCWIEYMNIA